MNYSKIDRRKFIQMGAVLASAPILLLNSLSCSDSSAPSEVLNEKNFIEILAKKKIFHVNLSLRKVGEEQVFAVPYATVNLASEQKNKYCVVRRILSNDGEMFLQTVVVKKAGIQNNDILVIGVNENDDLFYQPKEVICELAGINRPLLKRRFLKLVDNFGE